MTCLLILLGNSPLLSAIYHKCKFFLKDLSVGQLALVSYIFGSLYELDTELPADLLRRPQKRPSPGSNLLRLKLADKNLKSAISGHRPATDRFLITLDCSNAS